MKHNHNHSCTCIHASVKYCSHCNTVFCEGCNQEWTLKGQWSTTVPYWYYYNSYPNTNGTMTGDQVQTVSNTPHAVSCKHVA